MIESKILEYHKALSDIYDNAEILFKQIINEKNKAVLDSYNNHYIKINDAYVSQKYYMPVISIENKGDICFNFDGISFEFYISKNKLLNLNTLDKLIALYENRISIYEFKNCIIDVYENGDNIEKIITNIENSNDDTFGISIDCRNLSNRRIIDCFNKICNLLDIQAI